MKKGNIREVLEQLRQELRQAENVDLHTKQELEALHRDIDQLEQAERSDADTLRDRAREMESRFAAEHPTLERIARDLADAIGKMGV